jgi:hypothetical protein|tara:strand:+ start:374 stop:625 length:252 start_codon:yes stop_codon:yes gene_type:complete
MSVKYIVREEKMLNEFIFNIFKVIARKKGKKLAQKLRNDPEMVKILKQADNVADDIYNHIEKKRKEDPEYKKANDFFNAFLKM